MRCEWENESTLAQRNLDEILSNQGEVSHEISILPICSSPFFDSPFHGLSSQHDACGGFSDCYKR
jgi:hypothetical protein